MAGAQLKRRGNVLKVIYTGARNKIAPRDAGERRD
jgi:hypothetical protein